VGATGTEALHNVAVGSKSLYLNTIGSSNTAAGFQALYNASTGNGNTAVGDNALYNLTTGSNNTIVGYAGWPTGNTTYSNYTGLGYFVGTSVSDPSNRVEIGNTSVGWIGGMVTWSTYSDRRIKEDVRQNVPGLDFILKLKPVSYNLNIHRQNEIMYGDKAKEIGEWAGKYDIEQNRITGFIAQEVEAAAQSIAYDFSGVDTPQNKNDLYSLRYSAFVVPLVKAVQEQQEQMEQLVSIMQNMSAENGDLKDQLISVHEELAEVRTMLGISVENE
jgi:hypothetical protein